MNIKILGGGCSKCEKLAKNAEAAAKQLNIDYTIEKISDFKQYAAYGVMITPALVIDEKLISAGKVLSTEKIVEEMKKHQERK